MSCYDVAIDRTSLGLLPLVLHGDEQAGWGIMPNWQIPGLQPRTQSAESFWLDGSPATSFTWADSFMSGDIVPDAVDAADLNDLVSQLRDAIGRLSYLVTTSWKGVEQVWTCRPGSLVPSPIDWREIRDDQPVYSLTIPCHPIPGA